MRSSPKVGLRDALEFLKQLRYLGEATSADILFVFQYGKENHRPSLLLKHTLELVFLSFYVSHEDDAFSHTTELAFRHAWSLPRSCKLSICSSLAF